MANQSRVARIRSSCAQNSDPKRLDRLVGNHWKKLVSTAKLFTKSFKWFTIRVGLAPYLGISVNPLAIKTSCGLDSSQPFEIQASTIRPLQRDDLLDLAELLVESFHPRQGLGRLFHPLLRLGTYEDLRNRFANSSGNCICLVALLPSLDHGHQPSSHSRQLVGTIEMTRQSASPWQQRKTDYLYLSSLAVHARYRRQGIAQQLLQSCEQTAIQMGFQDLYLHVMENNQAARRLYAKLGYRVLRTDPSFGCLLPRRPRRLFLQKSLTISRQFDAGLLP